MSVKLCSAAQCTACGLCIANCGKKAISFQLNEYGCEMPVIDQALCISCQKCKRICPAENTTQGNPIKTVYAAWSLDEDIRLNAASGGMASTICHYALDRGWKAFGVDFTPDQGAVFIEVSSDNLSRIRNSKYSYASDTLPYDRIAEAVSGGKTIFIGLPCQVAAVKKHIATRQCPADNLFSIDLLCHGIAPRQYILQHLSAVKAKKGDTVFFRDPQKGTRNYYFSVIRNGRTVYSRKVEEDDVYQLGYHKALIYRENCYNCQYTNTNRMGDLTLGDFSGLGKTKPIAYSGNNVNCVTVNTDRGMELLNALTAEGLISIDERPIEEAIQYEHQFIAPSVPHKKRTVFLEKLRETGSFEISAKFALKQERNRYHRAKYSGKLLLQELSLRVITPEMRRKVKGMIKG